MAKPKMAMIPSTVGGSVYSVLPSNGDGDFNFSRASAATRINAQGLIETVAVGDNRLNYPLLDGTVQTCPHLLLEPQRTNTAFPSESFSGYTGTAATIVSNQATSPDGYANADLIYPSASGNFVGKYKTLAPSTTGVVSCFVKQAGKRYAIVGTDNNATYTCIFDLQTATVVYEATNYTGKIEAFANGWYRVSAAYSASTAANYPFIGLADDAAGAVTVDNTNGLYIWGFQYETSASYATSYIPTTSSATTRIAEVCDGSGNASTFNGSEGVLFVQMSALANNATTRRINLRNSSGSNQIRIEYGSSSNLISGVLFNGSNQAVINNTSYNVIDLNKIAFKYKENDFALWINGVKVGVDTSGTTIGAGILDRIDLSLATTETYSNVKQIQYFDSALNDTDLETLTSWTSFSEMATSQLYSIQ
jgi:hypothetical protein